MSLLVQKFGGTSVNDPDKIRRVAQRIAAARAEGYAIVAVVSAMGGTTDALISLSHSLSDMPDERELDLLLSTGEQASAAALAIALREADVDARSFSGRDAGILTDGVHGRARIVDVVPNSVRECVDAGIVPVTTGFQGVSRHTGELTTLGRGGSDTTAVALAAALRAAACEIYTDVEGVFTADPRHVQSARKIDHLTYEEMSELAASGAKVLASSSVEYASTHRVPVHVRSSADEVEGTWVTGQCDGDPLEMLGERFVASGIAHQTNQLRCQLHDVAPGAMGTVFGTLADAALPVDMVSYRTREGNASGSSLLFTVQASDQHQVTHVLSSLERSGAFAGCEWSGPIGKVSMVGRGFSAHPRALALVLDALRARGIALGDMAVSNPRISVTCREDEVLTAVGGLHEVFLEGAGTAQLDWPRSSIELVRFELPAA
jgi:aspartate kinase